MQRRLDFPPPASTKLGAALAIPKTQRKKTQRIGRTNQSTGRHLERGQRRCAGNRRIQYPARHPARHDPRRARLGHTAAESADRRQPRAEKFRHCRRSRGERRQQNHRNLRRLRARQNRTRRRNVCPGRALPAIRLRQTQRLRHRRPPRPPRRPRRIRRPARTPPRFLTRESRIGAG